MLQQITEDMKQAMRDKNKVKLSVIRMLRAALKDFEIKLGHPLNPEDVIAVVGKSIKQRKDAATQYTEANRADLADQELAEIEFLKIYLPEQLSDDEVAQAVQDAVSESGATSMRDMGKVMAILRPNIDGKADMGIASSLVKKALQGA
ncbi:MAG: GatB/YqeY domain-containing protein [Zetaproteobacteria bacterium]|nr:GatB/YqeY domain-containing protein [Zetaproteobacteria bacterium]